MRIERDALGERALPADALHGIQTERAMENFSLSGRTVHPDLVHAYGAVKLACVRINARLGFLAGKSEAIEQASLEMMEGRLDAHVRVDALQGGAGTSLNLNVCEVIANRALQLLGHAPGTYTILDPLDDVNLHQSTNDTFPTALRIAALRGATRLEEEVTALVDAFQDRERAFQAVIKVGRTEMQDAVLTTLGRSMGAFADALARDRWRLYQCRERLRVVNLGGTAIGTGLGAPRQYIFQVVDELRSITGLGVARAENMVDATQNLDALVEVSGMVRTLATNLIKIANDLRLLSSGPEAGLGEIRLPAVQPGSSIMPGKVNPVIPEAVVQCALFAMAGDAIVAQAAILGSLELNPFLPVLADSLLSGMTVLCNAVRMFRERCIVGMEANPERCRAHSETTTALATALVERLGYHQVQEVVLAARASGRSVREVLLEQGRMTPAELDEVLTPDQVLRLGFPLSRKR